MSYDIDNHGTGTYDGRGGTYVWICHGLIRFLLCLSSRVGLTYPHTSMHAKAKTSLRLISLIVSVHPSGLKDLLAGTITKQIEHPRA